MANFPKFSQILTKPPKGPGQGSGQSMPNLGVGSTAGSDITGVPDPTQPDPTWNIESPLGNQGGPAWGAIQPQNLTPNQPTGSLDKARQQMLDAQHMVNIKAMGPYAKLPATSVGPGGGGVPSMADLNAASSILNQVQKGTGSWAGGAWTGPLASAPQHKGWAGLQDYAKEWALRTLGQFPQLYFASGYRSPAQNAALPNAAPNSGHMRGVKVDFGGTIADLKLAAAWLRQFGAQTYIHPPGKEGYHLDVSFAPIGRI